MKSIKLDSRDKRNLTKLTYAFLSLIQRDSVECGGWGLDSKRPFGNSDYITDILEIIGEERYSNCPGCGPQYSVKQEEYAARLYDMLGPYLREVGRLLKDKLCLVEFNIDTICYS